MKKKFVSCTRPLDAGSRTVFSLAATCRWVGL